MTLTTRLAIAMILLVAIAVTAVGWLSYRSLEQGFLPRVLDRIETHSRLVAADLQSHVRGARAQAGLWEFWLLGEQGGTRESRRVDRSGPNGEVRVVPDAELQRKGDRP